MNINWQTLTNPPPLKTPDVHIWKTNLNINNSESKKLFSILSQPEKNRADRFKFAVHRERYIASQAGLRILLSRYLSIPPQNVSFIQGEHGKPYLVNQRNIFFNLTNSQELALYAVNLDNEIGIDVEYFRDKVSYVELVDRFFSSQEKQSFLQLPESEQKAAFFRLWTAKEAFIKAVGAGLSFPLHEFTIDVALNKEQLLEIKGDREIAKNWSLKIFEPIHHYTATVVSSNTKNQLSFFRLTLDS